jgi:hypothetical protein
VKIETLKELAWNHHPIPPIGEAPWNRKKHWFRWYVVYTILYMVYKIKERNWRKRTGGLQVWLD